ncbi:hypothetical protein A15D_01169 [Alcanivorax sp. MD8A]|nr:hypothetical protein A15D_01169 [Alcanivorax sp. MD8A]
MLAQPYGANVATMAADHVISENGDAGVTGMPNPVQFWTSAKRIITEIAEHTAVKPSFPQYLMG